VILEGYAPSGFDVTNLIKKMDEEEAAESGALHMNGSVLAFPFGCFLWKVERAKDVTLESLAPVILHRPKLDYLFIGCNYNGKDANRVPLEELSRIQTALKPLGIVVEQMSLTNAIGTFNILNAEDRQVAAALVMEPDDEDT
jgi:uncharacterized protein